MKPIDQYGSNQQFLVTKHKMAFVEKEMENSDQHAMFNMINKYISAPQIMKTIIDSKVNITK